MSGAAFSRSARARTFSILRISWFPICGFGSLVYLLFCTSRYGWGWKNFQNEANDGGGIKVRDGIRFYVSYILPLIVLVIFVLGIKDKFFA